MNGPSKYNKQEILQRIAEYMESIEDGKCDVGMLGYVPVTPTGMSSRVVRIIVASGEIGERIEELVLSEKRIEKRVFSESN